MGLYATTTSLSELIPRTLIGNTTTADTYGTAIFTRSILKAEAKIDACLSSRYSLPFTATEIPPLVRSLAEDIACYMYIRSTYVQDGERENVYLDSFKEAKETLISITEGKIQLVNTAGANITPLSSSRYKSSTINYVSIFELDDDKNWDLGNERATDIADARD